MTRHRVVKDEDVASTAELQAEYEAALTRRGTPQSTIDAVMYCVRARGLAALREPKNVARIATFDDAAIAQMNDRIGRLQALAKKDPADV